MKRMPVLTASGVGLLLGLLCCVQASETFVWMPEDIFVALHFPAILTANLLIQGEQALVLMPLTIILQWTLLGVVGGVIWKAAKASGPQGR